MGGCLLYTSGSIVPEEELSKALKVASRHIDSLTYNRIVGRGFSSLTDFQQEVIREVVCMQTDFEYENADEINSCLLYTSSCDQHKESWKDAMLRQFFRRTMR